MESAIQPAGESLDSVPLLLHSIDAFGEVPLGAIEIARPRRLVEIGGEGGTFTRSLIDYADAHDAAVLCIDPQPSDALRRLAAETRLELIEGFSPEALADLEPCDLYVVDGDHNHHVVSGELEAIARLGGEPLVIMHDVAWPCARRDFYYGPERLPAEAVKPHSFTRGVRPGDAGTAEHGGLSGMGAMAIAEQEGGERNGVLTAVEDFLAGREDLAWAVVPCIYGLGFMWPKDAPWAGELAGFLRPYDGSPLLANLEANRLKLYLRVLELQGETERRIAAFERASAAYEDRIAELSAELLRLRTEGR